MSAPPYLLHLELVKITGYKQKSRQCGWLKGARIKFTKNAYDEPIVSRPYWEGIPLAGKPDKDNGPDWGAVDKALSQGGKRGRPDQAPLQ